MKRFSYPQKRIKSDTELLEKNNKPHFRLTSLFIYFVFLLLFNFVIAPMTGLGIKQVSGAGIDPNRLVDLANQSRMQNGLGQLTVDQRLVNAANAKAQDMFKKQYWSHYGPNGETPWQFIIGAGYQYTYAGENLAKDFTDTDSVHQAWMNSATHRANILNVNYKNVGIAAVSGKQICNGTYPNFSDNTLSSCIDTIIVVQMFGTSVDTTPSAHPIATNTVNTPVPTAIPTPTPVKLKSISTPQIDSPQNNSYLNNSLVEIKGKSDDGTSVTVYEGDKKIGTVLSNGGVFDIKDINFTDGDHTVKANAKLNDSSTQQSDYSKDLHFKVITSKPVFQETDVSLQSVNNSTNDFVVDGIFSENTINVKVNVGGVITDLQKVDDTTRFRGVVNIPLGNAGIVLSAYDQAGNVYSSEIKINKDPIVQNTSLKITPVDQKTGMTSKQTINILIGFFILGLFITDSVFIWKAKAKFIQNNLTLKTNNRGNLIHHFIPVLIVIVATLLTFSGQVL